ncbi:LysR family transcriptional regulator [Marinomonas rhizomae]|uniref:Molybdate transport repressor ModE-like protein n=1 Tax=Marinomonas rhizomae TaxID=491948 RepID=A0A366IV59_9GAMM|nr:LysR family transcriptional regulator [Marinomonas rhizomae]RBP77914.1 molybdate transport repressor ModE-like protein [Marinomonas rhizomae]RNF68893.1 LysR family transcriptional regulator [Marinomonas rhizomae]
MLNTQHLITFKALVETGSFTNTAKQLGLTQPAVSQHIQKLERDLGESLLIRHGRTTDMTPAGEVLLQHIQALEACYESFIVSWKSHQESKSNDECQADKSA